MINEKYNIRFAPEITVFSAGIPLLDSNDCITTQPGIPTVLNVIAQEHQKTEEFWMSAMRAHVTAGDENLGKRALAEMSQASRYRCFEDEVSTGSKLVLHFLLKIWTDVESEDILGTPDLMFARLERT